MWQLSDDSNASGKLTRWLKVGPLGANIDRVFSNLVYGDNSSPLPLTIWCNPDVIIILAETGHLSENEIDITVADKSLRLRIGPFLEDDESKLNITLPQHPPPDKIYTIPLLYQVNLDWIEAEFCNNLLHIKLRRLGVEEAELENRTCFQ